MAKALNNDALASIADNAVIGIADRLDKIFPKIRGGYLQLKYPSGSYISHLEMLATIGPDFMRVLWHNLD
ncbi:hypothetical protein ACFL0M_08360 [Thermodesulfobacteriota bacterium]